MAAKILDIYVILLNLCVSLSACVTCEMCGLADLGFKTTTKVCLEQIEDQLMTNKP